MKKASTRRSALAKVPKSTVCEVQQWTVTAVREAQATLERFIALPARSDDPEGGRCEVFRWSTASAEEVVKMKPKDTGRLMRCVECKMPVRLQQARLGVDQPPPHFEHRDKDSACLHGGR